MLFIGLIFFLFVGVAEEFGFDCGGGGVGVFVVSLLITPDPIVKPARPVRKFNHNPKFIEASIVLSFVLIEMRNIISNKVISPNKTSIIFLLFALNP